MFRFGVSPSSGLSHRFRKCREWEVGRVLKERVKLERALDHLFGLGRAVFALAIIALGIEALVSTGSPMGTLNRFGAVIGPVLVACGVGLLFQRSMRTAAAVLGSVLLLYTLVFEVPRYVAMPGNMSFRTTVFEPLSLATLAWLLPGRNAIPNWLARASRYLLAVSFIVFGVDHFIGLGFIGTLVPNWIPWHAFWVALFGAGFIAAGASIAFDFLLRWGAAGIGLMFASWSFTLHFPRTVLGLSGGAGPHSPAEWSSLFIATALWGGCWALARGH